MDPIKVKAIVLKSSNYKEKDKQVTLFTLEKGIVNTIFKSVRKQNARLKPAKEIMTFGEFIFVDGKNNIVTSVEIIDSFYDITKDIKKYYAVCLIFDAILHSMPYNEPNVTVFIDTLKSLESLSYGNENINVVVAKFLINLFENLGFKITFDVCSVCKKPLKVHKIFNYSYGDITCYACKSLNYKELENDIYSTFRLISITDFDNISTLRLKEECVKAVVDILCKSFENRFGVKPIKLF